MHYRDLSVWQKAMEVAVLSYRMAARLPKNEPLAYQIRKTAGSIPANIAEGRTRRHTREFIQYVAIATASVAELETHVELARRVGYSASEEVSDIQSRLGDLGRMLNSLSASLRARLRRPDP